jgi:hypothetical protein
MAMRKIRVLATKRTKFEKQLNNFAQHWVEPEQVINIAYDGFTYTIECENSNGSQKLVLKKDGHPFGTFVLNTAKNMYDRA